MHFCSRQMATKPKYNKKRASKGTKWGRIFYFLPFILVAIIVMLMRSSCNKNSDAPFESYTAYQIKIPKDYDIHGVDVSYFQENFSWQTLKKANEKNTKIGFVFIKATEGITRQDQMFKSNWNSAKKVGMPRGAYHYFIASRDGALQAQNFINNVKLEEGDLPPVLDVEHIQNATKDQLVKEVKTWLKVIEDHYDIKPIIYTNISFYNNYLGKDFDKYPLWIAHYQKHTLPRIDRSWLFWQHDEQGRIQGIRSNLDFNVFNGDSSDFKNILIR